jgi:hypothetical protein
MIWQNPWAWLGLLLVAVPIVVHLLARRSARVQHFPTLRFLQPTPPLATRRTRITDPLLLAVRIAIVVAAVAALAQPFVVTAERAAASARNVARVVVIDTSASALRADPVADTVGAAGSSATVVIRTAQPRDAIDGAVAWLAARGGRGEVLVWSDFQIGAIDSVDLARIPAHVGVQLLRVVVPARDSTIESATRMTRVRGSPSTGAYEWLRMDGDSAQHDLVSLGPDAQRSGAAAAMRAADLRGALTIARPVALLFDDVDLAARPLTQAWMTDVAVSLRDDDLLQSTAADTTAAGQSPWLPVTGDGAVSAASATIDGAERMVLRVRGEAASSATAALVAALGYATAAAPSIEELEPRTLPDEQLQRWQRDAADAPAAASVNGSDGRWLWVLVLVLLLIEAVLRRPRPVTAQ